MDSPVRGEAAPLPAMLAASPNPLVGPRRQAEQTNSHDPGGIVRVRKVYEPASPLAVLAAPVLIVDNWLALNVLLPRAFSGSPLVRQKDVPGLAFFALLST